MVSVNEKKCFIRWFLNHYQLKKRECTWMIDYIMRNEQLLKSVHFVEDISGVSKGMIMTTHCSEETAFIFRKGNHETSDAEKAFNDIRLNENEKVYLQLNFKDNMRRSEYLQILEENPHKEVNPLSTEYAKQAAEFLDYCIADYNRNSIEKRIDQAIDDNDKELFMKLTKELNELSIPVKTFKTVKSKALQVN